VEKSVESVKNPVFQRVSPVAEELWEKLRNNILAKTGGNWVKWEELRGTLEDGDFLW
jgi:hypothetical protein